MTDAHSPVLPDLEGIAARWALARMAETEAIDGGEGWDDAKIHLVLRSWHDVWALHHHARDGVDSRAAVIATVESFRQRNLTGDGSNHVIDRILDALATSDELRRVVDRVKRDHQAQWDREHREFHARRRNGTDARYLRGES